MSIYLSLLICIIGLLVFVMSKTNPDAKELGRLAYFAGLLVFLFEAATHVVKF
jgi:hypothetical protein